LGACRYRRPNQLPVFYHDHAAGQDTASTGQLLAVIKVLIYTLEASLHLQSFCSETLPCGKQGERRQV